MELAIKNMIQAMIFDMDGTLVQTEKLKALSYAKAAVELCSICITEEEVIEGFREVVGRSRREVAIHLIDTYDLAPEAIARMAELGVNTPWQAMVRIRLNYYEEMLADSNMIKGNQWPHNVAVLNQARDVGCKVGLATMSRCAQTQKILQILELNNHFDFVATRDDVEFGKPDPEIYDLVASELSVEPKHTLVLEDSPSGVLAAVNANMHVIAVGTPFTTDHLLAADFIDNRWVVTDPADLPRVLEEKIKEMRN
ncbi:MAG: HAD family phosphatase [Chloroflexota bacterium]